MAEHEGAAPERRVGEYGVGRVVGVGRHHRVVLRPRWADEDVLDVERQGLYAFDVGSIGKPFVEVLAVVEIGGDWKRYVCGAGGGDRLGEAGTGDEAHSVAAADEVPGDGEQWRHVAVDRHAGDDDRGHWCSLGIWRLLTTMA